MEDYINPEELISRGFVPESKRKDLKKYLEVRKSYLDSFGPGSEIKDLADQIKEVLERYLSTYNQFPDCLSDQISFLNETILPLVIELAQDEEREEIEKALSAIESLKAQMPGPDNVLEFKDWLNHFLHQYSFLEAKLRGLRDRLVDRQKSGE